jgi:hypothetical protein
LCYVLTAAFIITSIVMIARVVVVVGGLAATWRLQPIPGMVVDHAVIADGAAQFDLPGVAGTPSAVFVVKAGTRAEPGWIEGKLGKSELVLNDHRCPILWEATDWTVFPDRARDSEMARCIVARADGRRSISAAMDPAVLQAIAKHEALVIVAYSPQDAWPRGGCPTT